MSIRPLLMCLGVTLFAAAMLYLEAPGLMRDVQLRNATLVPARDLKVEEAKCTTHWWLVSNCSIKYVAPQARTRESINFSVFGTLGGERFQLMRTPDNRAVTTDIGIAKLTNRIMMAIVLLIAAAGAFYVSFRKAIA